MDNKRKEYIYWGSMGFTLFATALALSSGGMYFIENLSIQFFEDEPSPAVNLWVIAFSTVILAAFMIFSVWWSEKEDSTSKEINVTVEDWQKQTPLAEPWIPGKEANEIVLDNVGEVPLDEMEDGERILYKCFRYEGGEKHVFYRVLVKVTDEEDGPVLKDENDTDMEWIQEDTKCIGAWGFFDVRDITNYDDGSKYKEVPY
ncbi:MULTISPECIES: hypothetical protein [Parasutterella]|uniref:hypothetical protein n=1 Tax=Parasutterella TaxID=577310 RepID=UPI0035209241